MKTFNENDVKKLLEDNRAIHSLLVDILGDRLIEGYRLEHFGLENNQIYCYIGELLMLDAYGDSYYEYISFEEFEQWQKENN